MLKCLSAKMDLKIRSLLQRAKFQVAMHEQVFLIVMDFQSPELIQFHKFFTWDEYISEKEIYPGFYTRILKDGRRVYLSDFLGSYEWLDTDILTKYELVAIIYRPTSEMPTTESEITYNLISQMEEYLHSYENEISQIQDPTTIDLDLLNTRIRQINIGLFEIDRLKKTTLPLSSAK